MWYCQHVCDLSSLWQYISVMVQNCALEEGCWSARLCCRRKVSAPALVRLWLAMYHTCELVAGPDWGGAACCQGSLALQNNSL